ncbi:hypothetical protein BAUCODRAFT_472790 [Baudoinia panamericana UAMH 10762]|uniref:Cupin type-2 domain-containing protein n=1 Tax=Baudoinia panamericana (strain UAMH 10762) TaxID=717646 RepID=M2MI83_BAUPA|nr:uncharacterized protein BAUCODRAFT_472790 [Baudoinia panamericana UAMH 10762]EMC96376.1 hypothetical protein BAUCODRAFT_472790 [Baudoinia panamericana UAMH 10762]
MSPLQNGIDGVNGNSQVLPTTELPIGKPGQAYTISSQDGEIIYIPLSKSATRLLITGKETDNAFAIVGSGGSQGDPIGFHYHNEAHDVFLCLQGKINVWAGDQCRTMEPGDFASVPPGAIHQYQILGPHSEMIGLIVPGGWEEFFRSIGDPYSGPMWPINDDRNFFEVMLPRLKAATEQFDMVPCPQHKQFDPQPWSANDNHLPNGAEPFFLRNASGPAYELGGTICRPLITTAQSRGKFAIAGIESSNQYHQQSIFAESKAALSFTEVHHAFLVTEGSVEVCVDHAAPSKLAGGDVIYIPKGAAFKLRTTSRFSKMYAFASGAGIVELLCEAGKAYEHSALPEKAGAYEMESIKALEDRLKFHVQ